MSRAFTLLEVLISTVILAIVGTGLLQISINSKKNFEFLKNRSKFEYLASIPFIHNNQKLHNSDRTLYQFVEESYSDLDDDLRQFLKEYKIHYEQEEFSTFSPLQADEDSSDNYDMESSGLNLTIIFDKISISHDKESAFVYKINLPMGEKKSE
jgi:prepilin-type N-terminal cleavage/methylation domain-containing protein